MIKLNNSVQTRTTLKETDSCGWYYHRSNNDQLFILKKKSKKMERKTVPAIMTRGGKKRKLAGTVYSNRQINESLRKEVTTRYNPTSFRYL